MIRERRQNWAGNHTYKAAGLHFPETLEEVQELVARHDKVKVLGSRHSFNSIADTEGEMLSLERFNPALHIDPERRTVKIGGGMRYGELAPQLHRAGFALHNLASLPHISVAGAVATATHGSGVQNGSLATAVAGLELVKADGEIVRLSREEGEAFRGAVVGLGGLGVVTSLTLDLVPAFEVRQEVYENLALSELEANFEAIVSSAYSVSLFTDWRGARFNQVWLKSRVEPGAAFSPEPGFFGATAAPAQRHMLSGHPPENTTEQMGVPGPWYERLPHFRLDHTPSSGEELQSEYLVPREHAVQGLRVLSELRGRIAPLLMACEVRTVAADDLWMSPFYRRGCVGFHFTWKQDWPALEQLLPLIEAGLEPLSARPHWGKLFTLPPERVQALFERLPEFRQLLQAHDPKGKFRNAFLDQYIF